MTMDDQLIRGLGEKYREVDKNIEILNRNLDILEAQVRSLKDELGTKVSLRTNIRCTLGTLGASVQDFEEAAA
mgnify:CR=1 FL=1